MKRNVFSLIWFTIRMSLLAFLVIQMVNNKEKISFNSTCIMFRLSHLQNDLFRLRHHVQVWSSLFDTFISIKKYLKPGYSLEYHSLKYVMAWFDIREWDFWCKLKYDLITNTLLWFVYCENALKQYFTDLRHIYACMKYSGTHSLWTELSLREKSAGSIIHWLWQIPQTAKKLNYVMLCYQNIDLF